MLILGIAACLIALIPIIGLVSIVLAIAALVLGSIAIREGSRRAMAETGVALGVGSIVLLVVVDLLIPSLPHSSASVTNSPDVVVPTPKMAPPSGLRLIYEHAGVGDTTTAKFTTPAEWAVQWSFDCSKQPTGRGVLDVESEDRDAHVSVDDGSTAADMTYVHDDAGSHYLDVTTDCDWTLRVFG
ncbi:hypothetical protein [Sinomonas humi]|uniref:Uncharacterized protein n=1 Tax=Sinomonas humi TaxID=1338436 RepID=A0A0B2AUK0_9MICC|nr:hypothetical protein [Sinomonas humi]KHL05675.1 hypothetical protein LK10_00020 [Sinomonas humi]